ncbi:DUF2306 domain-containing protein [Maribacter sp. 2307ULW6-5]|uniref:DUF2306 domain-containing protein n=1 Tax=Maribacter sp. 2307ULW6-5 TaxID=3386275 RepID=UPI0039BCBB10
MIILHAVLGGTALLAGTLAIVATKGGVLHKGSGKVFYWSMLLSALSSLVIALMPGHENAFLFCIGLFTIYLILSGYRALRFKKPGLQLTADKAISAGMLVTGLVMVLYPLLLTGAPNIVLTVFGAAGMVFGAKDLRDFSHPKKLRKVWLRVHLGKMTGAFIASVSAFLVVNQTLPPLWSWFLPTVLGSFYIAYWLRKVRLKSLKKNRI